MSATDATNDGKSGIVSIQEAAARLRKSERTIQRYIRSGKLNTVEIAGRPCVQFGDLEDVSALSDAAVIVSDKTPDIVSDSVRQLQDKLDTSYRDQIAHLEAENIRLWQEVQAKQNTIDGLMRMFPLPQQMAPIGAVAVAENLTKPNIQDAGEELEKSRVSEAIPTADDTEPEKLAKVSIQAGNIEEPTPGLGEPVKQTENRRRWWLLWLR